MAARNPRGFYAYDPQTKTLYRFMLKRLRDDFLNLYPNCEPFTAAQARAHVPWQHLAKAPDSTATFEGSPVAVWGER